MSLNYEKFQTSYHGHVVRWQGMVRLVSNDLYDVEITSDGKPIGQNARAFFQVPPELQSTYYQYALDQQPRDVCGIISNLNQSAPYLILTATFPRDPTRASTCESIVQDILGQPQPVQLTIIVKPILPTEQIGSLGNGQNSYSFQIDISQSPDPTWNNRPARLCVPSQSPALNSFYQLSQSPSPSFVNVQCSFLNYTEQEGFNFLFIDFVPQSGIVPQQNQTFGFQPQQVQPQQPTNDETIYPVTCTLSSNVEETTTDNSILVRFIPITILDADPAFRSRYCVDGKIHYVVVFGRSLIDQPTRNLIATQQSCKMSLQYHTHSDTAFYFSIFYNITDTQPIVSGFPQQVQTHPQFLQAQPQMQATQSGGFTEIQQKWLDPIDGKLMTLPVYGADRKLYHEPTLSAYLDTHQGIGPNGKKWMTKFFVCQSVANEVNDYLQKYPNHPLRR
ncbi:hypothetical protein BLNAU_4883 [Blattamonas nauphoetae]|uniref:Uncharacterized protein n=1 Tax=Blattamonas nauphoetae TaxID=2049346 RepID=A0ABQ9Y8D8_9EUKA|nr:hypothetical protein BLNAU_4883 [Blattamonas nauphoetae]